MTTRIDEAIERLEELVRCRADGTRFLSADVQVLLAAYRREKSGRERAVLRARRAEEAFAEAVLP